MVKIVIWAIGVKRLAYSDSVTSATHSNPSEAPPNRSATSPNPSETHSNQSEAPPNCSATHPNRSVNFSR